MLFQDSQSQQHGDAQHRGEIINKINQLFDTLKAASSDSARRSERLTSLRAFTQQQNALYDELQRDHALTAWLFEFADTQPESSASAIKLLFQDRYVPATAPDYDPTYGNQLMAAAEGYQPPAKSVATLQQA